MAVVATTAVTRTTAERLDGDAERVSAAEIMDKGPKLQNSDSIKYRPKARTSASDGARKAQIPD